MLENTGRHTPTSAFRFEEEVAYSEKGEGLSYISKGKFSGLSSNDIRIFFDVFIFSFISNG